MEFFKRLRENFEVLYERHKKAILIGLVVGGIVVNFGWVLMPLLMSVYRTSVEMGTLSKDVKAIREDEANEEKIASDLETIKGKLAAAEKRVAIGDIYLYLESLSKIAQDSGVRIVTVKPMDAPAVSEKASRKDKQKKGPYRPAFFEIAASAGYHSLGKFLAKLESSPVFIRVTRLEIRANEDSAAQHDINMNILMVQKSGGEGG